MLAKSLEPEVLFKKMESVSETIQATESTHLDYWMESVVRECDHVRGDFAPEPVHDLRVALRRCRSMADGYMAFDPHPAWKQMKGEGRRLFQQFGALRDTQVMEEWIRQLAPSEDAVYAALRLHLSEQASRFKESAAEAVRDFNRKKWISWTRLVSARARRLPPESLAFQHLALERWSQARHLHRQALRNRSQIAYHKLRIGLKKFRYTVENFLPARHGLWGAELRELQDLLGEMHDLDVLWRTAVSIRAFPGEKERKQWRRRIEEEHAGRLERYRAKMMGRTSLFFVWREGLPAPGQLKATALARIRTWASFRDPDFAHSEHVARLALQLYDGLHSLGLFPENILPEARYILNAAALAHDVGKSGAQKKHRLASYRMLLKLDPPTGWSGEMLEQVALIARFHRGALPRPEQKAFAGMPADVRRAVILLCGILRLANAFDLRHHKRIRRLQLKREGNMLLVTAPGYVGNDATAEKIAAARHLLESVCRLPVFIQ